jgi:hypothetical protein
MAGVSVIPEPGAGIRVWSAPTIILVVMTLFALATIVSITVKLVRRARS